jgi:protoporphyrinogen oxidase
VSTTDSTPRVVVIGGGFCGLAAAYYLVKRGVQAILLECDTELGGLAGSFPVNGTRLEKFYHYWYTSDRDIVSLIDELGAADNIVVRATRTGLFHANTIFRLSSPLDVLRFAPLPWVDRIRLGMLAIRVRSVHDWKALESLSASEWLRRMAGDKVYDIVWKPLLRGKFGDYAEEISAVWFWNKLKLRGSSRGTAGREQLAYYRGGFAALADRIAERVRAGGGQIHTGTTVDALSVSNGRLTGVMAKGELISADAVISTTPLPITADIAERHLPDDYISSLRRIQFLANICIVLELDRSLSQTCWLNVNDPSFPFVAVIEHTNCEPAETYGGRHIVYLSKYLPAADPIYAMSESDILNFTLPHLQRMFPEFSQRWILKLHVWRARYAQPIVERHYSRLIPSYAAPLNGLYLASMAQIYPEDRGTNYAVRAGKHIADIVSDALVSAH